LRKSGDAPKIIKVSEGADALATFRCPPANPAWYPSGFFKRKTPNSANLAPGALDEYVQSFPRLLKLHLTLIFPIFTIYPNTTIKRIVTPNPRGSNLLLHGGIEHHV
jgi:hypothetical protein